MRNRRWIGVIAGLVVVGLIVAYVVLRHKPTVDQAPAAPQVAVATAHVGDFTQKISAVGRVGAPAGAQSKIAFAVTGILQRVDVRVGEHVVAGQTLAQLNTGSLALTAQQAQADARAATASAAAAAVDRTTTKLAVDQRTLERAQTLYAAGVGARKDIEAAKAQVAADRADRSTIGAQRAAAAAQAQSASAHAALTQRDLSNGTLLAPSDGVVLAILKQPGESVDPSTPVVAIGPAAQNELTLNVAAGDAQRVRVGNPVTVTIPGTNLQSHGRVIGVTPAVDPTTQSATVVVSGVPPGSVAGSAVSATIVVGHSNGVLVPQSAIVQDPQSGKTVVFLQTHDKSGAAQFEQRVVQIAQSDGKVAQIGSGLRAGDKIAAQGAFALLAPGGG
ncbi:MAG TPA: efflux RND transporter periplasmic adaptor subunit [Candidatus Baltobacteraceae bacterium]|jgi:RND family efflux transporter MFP subunit